MKKDLSSDYYETNWDSYYRSLKDKEELIPWDVPPEKAVMQDLKRMKPFLDPQVPLVDIGCGLGTQTACLANHFVKATGTDISDEAIRSAVRKYQSYSNLDFKTLNILNTNECRKFYQNHGDSNLYMRGTLQQIITDDRTDFAISVKILLGKTGKLYFIELSTKAKDFFLHLYKTKKEFPASLNRVLRQKVTQLIGVHLDELSTIFPATDFHILHSGEDSISLKFGDENIVSIPATYGIIQNKTVD